MNYLQWNNAIVRHFFNPEYEEKEVTLYFSEKIIEEIGQENFTQPEEGFIIDFYKALRLGVNGVLNDDYIQRILYLESKYTNGTRRIANISFDYPPYLTYLLAFILPFTSGDANEELNMNNFHDYAKTFFEKNSLTTNYDRIIRHHLNQIDFLWKNINNWLIEINNFRIGYIEELNPPGNRKYVRKFEYHILFRKEQEERLSKVFDNNNILPGDAIEEKEIKKILVQNKVHLKLSAITIKKINQNDYIGEKIVKRAYRFYKNWDGTTHTVEGQRGYSRNRLVLCIGFNTLNQQINFKYFRIFSKNGIPENCSLLKQNGDLIENINQFKELYSNPIDNCFENIESNVELKDEANRNKYTWKAKDFFIFKRIPNFDWVEIAKVEFNNRRTLVVCKREFFDGNLYEWFEKIKDNKKLYNDNKKTQLPENWLAFTVDNITNYPHSTLYEFIPDKQEKPRISFDKSFYFDGQLFKDQLPNLWIENIETEDDIFSIYHDETKIQLEHVIVTDRNENGIEEELFINKYIFTYEHLNRANDEFKLVCGNIETHRFFKIVDFEKRNNEKIDNLLPKRNSIGQTSNQEENYIKGLEHFFSQQKINELIPYQNLLDDPGHIFLNTKTTDNYTAKTFYDETHIGNILIHYISTKGKLTKSEFDNAVFKLLENIENNENIKKRTNYLRYHLQDAGYVDYNPEKSILTINKPHLVIKPTEKGIITFLVGARDAKLINRIINFSENNSLIIETQNEEDKLFPQIVYIKFKGIYHTVVSRFAEEFGLIFKKDGIYTQFALASHFSDITNWQNFINPVREEIEDFEGGFIFDIASLRFFDKPNDFDKELSFVKFTEINGYKTIYRLWYSNVVYNLTNQQLGIYLYLYLFKKIREDNYKACLNEKGWANCGEELDEKDKAPELTNIVLYDRNKKYLAVPLNCRLPRFLSISVALLNGKTPEIKYLNIQGVRHKGMYFIYKNTPTLFVRNTVDLKLNQRLIDVDITL